MKQYARIWGVVAIRVRVATAALYISAWRLGVICRFGTLRRAEGEGGGPVGQRPRLPEYAAYLRKRRYLPIPGALCGL